MGLVGQRNKSKYRSDDNLHLYCVQIYPKLKAERWIRFIFEIIVDSEPEQRWGQRKKKKKKKIWKWKMPTMMDVQWAPVRCT